MLINDDNLKVLPDFELDSVDHVVTDPPYGISFLKNKWDYNVPSREFWSSIYKVLKPGGFIISFSSARTYHRMVCNIEDGGFEIKDQLMWLYAQGMPKGGGLKPAHEPIVLAKKAGKSKLNVDACRIPCIVGDKPVFPVGNYSTDTQIGKIRPTKRIADKDPTSRYPANVLCDLDEPFKKYFFCSKDRSKYGHPTVKPIPLMEWLIQLVSYENQVVFDPFMGSGTTGIACKNTGRQFIGIEKNPDYFKLAQTRINTHVHTI